MVSFDHPVLTHYWIIADLNCLAMQAIPTQVLTYHGLSVCLSVCIGHEHEPFKKWLNWSRCHLRWKTHVGRRNHLSLWGTYGRHLANACRWVNFFSHSLVKTFHKLSAVAAADLPASSLSICWQCVTLFVTNIHVGCCRVPTSFDRMHSGLCWSKSDLDVPSSI